MFLFGAEQSAPEVIAKIENFGFKSSLSVGLCDADSINGHCYQRWGPRGHILKSLASKPYVFENCAVLGSRTALFFEQLKFRWKTPETS